MYNLFWRPKGSTIVGAEGDLETLIEKFNTLVIEDTTWAVLLDPEGNLVDRGGWLPLDVIRSQIATAYATLGNRPANLPGERALGE